MTLREVWSQRIAAEDYEQHMRAIGQAEANAWLTAEFVTRWVPAGSRLLIPGAGPGQAFEFLPAGVFSPLQVTFADLNPAFVERLLARLADAEFRYRTVVDDFENTAIEGPFDAALLILLLEHIDWTGAAATLARLGIGCAGIVIQQNPEGLASAVTPGRLLPGSMQAFETAHPRLVPREGLIESMARAGYRLTAEVPRAVADGKQMLLLVFTRTP